MFSLFKEIFNAQPDEPVPDIGERVRLATCVLLIEVASVDDEFAPEEQQRILSALEDRFQLPRDDAEKLLETAADTRAASTDLWHFTNQINQGCSPDEKRRIIEEIWRVIYADGRLDGHEDYLVHKLARLLNLNHPQLIEAKMKVLNEHRNPQ